MLTLQLPVSDFSPRLPGNVPQDEQVPMMPHPGAMLGSGGTHPGIYVDMIILYIHECSEFQSWN